MSLFERAKKARENKKGFTLVELIVVLVILAILAAILVPALTGWIDKAKEKQIMSNARTVYLAAQTLASEKYADSSKDAPTVANVKKFLGEDWPKGVSESDVTIDPPTKGKITSMTYTEAGKTATLSPTGWNVS